MPPLRSVLIGIALAAIATAFVPSSVIAGGPPGMNGGHTGCRCTKGPTTPKPPGQGEDTWYCADWKQANSCDIKTYRGFARRCTDGDNTTRKCVKSHH